MVQPQGRGFQLVDEEPPVPPPGIDQIVHGQQKPPLLNRVSIQMMEMALGALGQRFTVALASLFTLLTVGAAFYIWLLIIIDPSQLQIVAASIFSAFILLVNYLNMRRGK